MSGKIHPIRETKAQVHIVAIPETTHMSIIREIIEEVTVYPHCGK